MDEAFKQLWSIPPYFLREGYAHDKLLRKHPDSRSFDKLSLSGDPSALIPELVEGSKGGPGLEG